MSEDIKTVGMSFLVDSGLLFKINLETLHPLGMALQVDPDTNECEIWDYRDDPEGLLFDAEAYEHGQQKIDRFFGEFVQERLALREKTTGFIIQPDPNAVTEKEK